MTKMMMKMTAGTTRTGRYRLIDATLNALQEAVQINDEGEKLRLAILAGEAVKIEQTLEFTSGLWLEFTDRLLDILEEVGLSSIRATILLWVAEGEEERQVAQQEGLPGS
jgi:hypothetical protein